MFCFVCYNIVQKKWQKEKNCFFNLLFMCLTEFFSVSCFRSLQNYSFVFSFLSEIILFWKLLLAIYRSFQFSLVILFLWPRRLFSDKPYNMVYFIHWIDKSMIKELQCFRIRTKQNNNNKNQSTITISFFSSSSTNLTTFFVFRFVLFAVN